MKVIFNTACKWSDGKTIFRFSGGPASVPDECAAWAFALGLAEPGKQPKPKKRAIAQTEEDAND